MVEHGNVFCRVGFFLCCLWTVEKGERDGRGRSDRDPASRARGGGLRVLPKVVTPAPFRNCPVDMLRAGQVLWFTQGQALDDAVV